MTENSQKRKTATWPVIERAKAIEKARGYQKFIANLLIYKKVKKN